MTALAPATLLAFAVAAGSGGLRGERVLLVAAEPDSVLALRMRDELAADGFDVIVRDDDDVIDVIQAARAVAAVAVVELHGSRVDLWNLTAPGDPEHASLSAAGVDRDVAAVRVAELLRARLLAPRPRSADAAPLDDDVDGGLVVGRRALAVGVEGAAGARADVGLAGFPASVSVAASAAVDVAWLRLGVDVTLPTLPAHIEAADGSSADVSVTRGALSAGARFAPFLARSLAAELAVSGGGAWLHGAGRAQRVGQVAHDADLVVGTAGLDARLLYTWSAPLCAFVAAGATALVPAPSFAVGADVVAAGPAAYVVAGVGFILPPASP